MAPKRTLSGDDPVLDPGPPQRRQCTLDLDLDPALRVPLGDSTTSAPQDHHNGTSLSHEDYTVAWICALSLELAASRAMLDDVHENLLAQRGDDNVYVLGSMGLHNVVMVALPGGYGKVNAATVSTNLKRTSPNIGATLMVGIGGGAPGEANLRLGDVVVATRVVEYDLGKALGDGRFERTASPKFPSQLLRSAMTNLRSKHGQRMTSLRMSELIRTRLADFERPKQPDCLFRAAYQHPDGAESCEGCDPDELHPRSQRPSTDPWIHYGGIACGDSVNKDAQKRDTISRKLSAVCFEMEAAGMMENLQCLPIRGICDYSDSHKNDHWQPYAAATAAAYARELLETIQPLQRTLNHRQNPRLSSQRSLALVSTPGAAMPSPIPPPLAGATRNGEDNTLAMERESFIKALSFPRMDERKSAIRPPQKLTCLWLLEHPLYLDWHDPDRQEDHHGFFWMRGKAGAGKSTLMKFLYSEAMKNNDKASVASFFFNARGEHLEKSITGMYRSLLIHLLNHTPQLFETLIDMERLSSSTQYECPGLNQLKDLLQFSVLSRGQRPLICFIDALDECDEDDVRDMMSFFEDLAEDATEQGVKLHVCFSSRPYPYVNIRRGLLLALEEEAGHATDLAQYVSKCLRVRARFHQDLQRRILEKASGVFMWVVLVVDILNKESSRGCLALRRRLSEIPQSLSQLFRDILTRDEENPRQLRQAIMWILCARRPLGPDEFCHAIWAGGLEDGGVDDELPDGTDRDSNIALVVSATKGLAEVVSADTRVVQFIHESVRDFLVRDRGLQDLWPDLGFEWEGQSHECLRRCCELYLEHPEVRSWRQDRAAFSYGVNGPSGAFGTKPEFVADHRCVLLQYALEEILHHSNLAAPCLSQTAFLARFFGFKSVAAIDYHRELAMPITAEPTTCSLIQLFSREGYGHLTKIVVEASRKGIPDRRILKEHYGAFFAAIQSQAWSSSSKDAIAALLGLPSLEYEGEVVETSFSDHSWHKGGGRTPLSWAAQLGHHTLAKVLIRNGESLVEKDDWGSTPFRTASRNGQVEVMCLLIDLGLEVTPEEIAREIYSTLELNKPEAACFLLERYDGRSKPKEELARDLSCWLSLAAGYTSEEIPELLITRHGIDLHGDSESLSPLTAAIMQGSLDRVVRLIDEGVDIHAKNRWQETPLITAVRRNQMVIAQLLVERGARLDAATRSRETAHALAIQLGRNHSF